MSENNTIKTSIERDVAVITIDRPERLGALTQTMRREITSLIEEYGGVAAQDATAAQAETAADTTAADTTATDRSSDSSNKKAVRGIVITGTGRAFSAGEDLQEITVSSEQNLIDAVETFHDITRAIIKSKVPVVAAINGLAVGGASEVAMSCDARVGSEDAAFLMPENGLGITISNASSLFLRRLVGRHATRIVLSSPKVLADEAHNIGLLDAVVSADELVQKAIDLALAYNPEGSATEQHLTLLRPTTAEVEAAIANENVAAENAWNSGVTEAGVRRFWENKNK